MNAVILVNKDKGKTSRDIVNELTKIFNTKKIGHTGTLDPIATGVLIVCTGKYTKLVNDLMSLNKTYIATITLGVRTDTLDSTGNILEEKDCKTTIDKINEVFSSLIGNYKQVIPIYSAKKVNGKRLYEYARENKKVDLPTNNVNIYDLSLISYENNQIKFSCSCEKGTYIRSLIETICEKLGCIGTMSDLERTKQGNFDISSSYKVDDIKKGNYKILNIRDLFNYETYNLNEDEYNKVKNGNHIEIDSNNEKIVLYYDNNEIAIYKKYNNIYIPDIMLI